MKLKKILNSQKKRRQFRVRNRVRGTADRPRLCVNRTLKHISCQLINDEDGTTIASASSRDKNLSVKYGGNCDAASAIGKAIAEKATAAGVKAVRLDRGTAKYHGRVAAFADAAREGGLDF